MLTNSSLQTNMHKQNNYIGTIGYSGGDAKMKVLMTKMKIILKLQEKNRSKSIIKQETGFWISITTLRVLFD